MVESRRKELNPLSKQSIGCHAYFVEVMYIWLASHDSAGRRTPIRPRQTINPRDWAEIQAVDGFVGSCRCEGAATFAAATIGEVALLLRQGFIARAVRQGLISPRMWKRIESFLRASELYCLTGKAVPEESEYAYPHQSSTNEEPPTCDPSAS